MNPRRHQEQIGLFQTFASQRSAAEIETIRAAAIRARDEALAAALRRLVLRAGQVLAAAAAKLTTWPERHRTYESLRSLTDRELADIGLSRGDIGRVFESGLHARAAVPPGANNNAPVAANRRAA
jgi:uncharacterized protein YjiS (DUF1127 family)